MPETGEAAVDLIHGDKLYQERARAALPILVRHAWAHETIYYSELAAELGIRNPRVLNYPLGSIGNAMLALAAEMGHPVPPIQALVIAKSTGLPGEGLSWFTPDATGSSKNAPRERMAGGVDGGANARRSRADRNHRWTAKTSAPSGRTRSARRR